MLNKLPARKKEKFLKVILKEVTNNLSSGAYEVLDRSESEHVRRTKAEKIMKSRYVLTEKGVEVEEVEKLQQEGLLIEDNDPALGPRKAKARHVMKGFSEQGAEDLASTTPQVAKETVFFTLQVISSMQWELGHLDFISCWRHDIPGTLC